jgi:hypothetical protein
VVAVVSTVSAVSMESNCTGVSFRAVFRIPHLEDSPENPGAKIGSGWREKRRAITGGVAYRDWVRDLLKESTGKSYPVKPVVLFPGWYVEGIGPHAYDRVWVLNPKGLPAFIAKEKTTLSLEYGKMATCHLSRYIRSLR